MSESSSLRIRRHYSELEKRAVLARQVASGKGIVSFCRDENIAVSSFHQWKKRYASDTVQTTSMPLFAEVAVTNVVLPKSSVQVRITLVSGVSVDTSSDCDPEWLGKVCQALRGASC